MNLLELSEDDFEAELSEAIFDGEKFKKFLEPELNDKTLIGLQLLMDSLKSQIEKHEGEDLEWEQRAKNFKRRVGTRILQCGMSRRVEKKEAADKIYSLSNKLSKLREHADRMESNSDGWKLMAATLAEKIEEMGRGDLLEGILLGETLSQNSQLSVGEWLELRNEYTASRA
jgi:mRNA deadenylase 3'-5' endonuclease subunit Ccr4